VRILGPKTVGKINRLVQNVPEYLPGEFFACSCDSTAMNRLGIGPETAATSAPEKLAGFTVNAFALPAGTDGQDEGDEPRKWKFPVPAKIAGR